MEWELVKSKREFKCRTCKKKIPGLTKRVEWRIYNQQAMLYCIECGLKQMIYLRAHKKRQISNINKVLRRAKAQTTDRVIQRLC